MQIHGRLPRPSPGCQAPPTCLHELPAARIGKSKAPTARPLDLAGLYGMLMCVYIYIYVYVTAHVYIHICTIYVYVYVHVYVYVNTGRIILGAVLKSLFKIDVPGVASNIDRSSCELPSAFSTVALRVESTHIWGI